MMVPVAAIAANHKGGDVNNINHILCQFVANVNASINNNLVQNVYCHSGDADLSDVAELQLLGLDVDYEESLPENLVNMGTMQ